MCCLSSPANQICARLLCTSFRNGGGKSAADAPEGVSAASAPPAVVDKGKGKRTASDAELDEAANAKKEREDAAKDDADDDDDDSDDDDEEEDGTLLTVQPGFNRLLLVLRDEGVMRFVKYVSASAPGSRWDVCCEYEVYQDQDSEGDGEAEADGAENEDE